MDVPAGIAFLYAGDPRRAIDLLGSYIRLDPFHVPMASCHLGFAHYMLKQYAQALQLLRECVSRSPNLRSGHVLLAATYARLGQIEHARAAAAEVLRIQPNYTIAGTARLMAPFKQPEDDKHFFDALRLAGLPE